MNKQGSKDNLRGGIEWTHILGPLTGYTANPVRGCEHDCQWRMPDGHVAICYAKAQKERLHGPGTFEKITWHPDVLAEIRRHKTPAGIFIDSMSDLFGQNVERWWIDTVIETMRACPQHVFFSLTKNPSRFREFTVSNKPWPANWLVGISAPPTFMFGRELTPAQQAAWLRKGLEFLRDSPAQKRWVSLEPLSFDVSPILLASDCPLDWAVIGAASDGGKTYQPDRETLRLTQRALAHKWHCPVFFKGNLDHNLAVQTGYGWRQEFPKL